MVALMASYSYIGVLDQGLLQRTETGKVDFDTLLAGSQNLRVGQETAWKWEPEGTAAGTKYEPVHIHYPYVAIPADLLFRLLDISLLSPSSSPNRAT
jgi:hydroxymethylglutaryl-CoA reductase (NADPH)